MKGFTLMFCTFELYAFDLISIPINLILMMTLTTMGRLFEWKMWREQIGGNLVMQERDYYISAWKDGSWNEEKWIILESLEETICKTWQLMDRKRDECTMVPIFLV